MDKLLKDVNSFDILEMWVTSECPSGESRRKMAEHDIEEKIESLRQFQKEIGPCEVITGGQGIKKRFLLYQLELSMLKAERIDMIVSFLMESGVRMILDDLEQALNRGVKIRILTGNYLGITQPGALCLIRNVGDRWTFGSTMKRDGRFTLKPTYSEERILGKYTLVHPIYHAAPLHPV